STMSYQPISTGRETRSTVRGASIVVAEEAEDGAGGEFIAAVESGEFHHERTADDVDAGFDGQLDAGLHGAAGRQEIVDEQDAIAVAVGVGVNLQRVAAVFEFVVERPR